ncbi:pilus assembly protein PilB [Myxococcaceae bacterium GXIMD 01537]
MRLGELLVSSGLLTAAQVATALAYQVRWRCKLGEALTGLHLLTQEQVQRALARQLQVPFIRTEEMEKVPAGMMKMVPAELLARLRICPLRVTWSGPRGTLYVATSQPENLPFLDEVSFATGCAVRPVLALADDIERLLRRQGVLSGRSVEAIELPDEECTLEITRTHCDL